MNCGNCGTLLPPDVAYCPNCGANTSNYRSFSATPPNDPTVVSAPYSAGPQTPPTAYGDSQPYQATPPPPTPNNPYNPYNPYNPTTPYPYTPYPEAPLTPVPAPPQRRGNRIGIIIGVAALVLLIAGGGIFTLLRPGSRNSPVTASPTVNATATAVVEDPYSHSGTLLFADPLSDNSKGHGWDVNSNCAFIDGAYHAIAPNPSFGDYCIAGSTDFSNFVFEVQMQVIKGDGGGIDFRDENTSTTNKYYDFYVWRDGSYELDVVNGSAKTLSSGSSVAINQSLNQTNVVAVVAQGSLIKLYVNHQLITSATDSTYSHGQIGVEANPFANNAPHPTEVVYSNARVWML